MRFAPEPTLRPDIAIDVTRLVGRYQQGRLPTGVDRVSLAYVRHFRERAVAKLSLRGLSGLVKPALSQALFDILLTWQPSDLAQRELKSLLYRCGWSTLTQIHWRGLWLFNTSHQGLESFFYTRDLLWHAHRPVYFLHDLIPITHPQFCRLDEASKHQARLRHMLAWGRGLIVNSQDTKQQLQWYAQEAKLKLPPVKVARLGSEVSGKFAFISQRASAESPYFLAIGTVEPRKNIPLLMRVWRRLVEQLGSQAPRLVVVGQMGWEDASVAAQLGDAQAWQGTVQWRQQCTDEELKGLLHQAQALLFPSFVEGYGLPVLEAMQCGVPVIASDLAVLREVAGEVPEYLSANDDTSWYEAVVEYSLPQSVRRAAQLTRLQDFAPNTWAEHFLGVDEFLQELVHG
jgi:glycosyltransferase involved in cell wall biosynthesis